MDKKRFIIVIFLFFAAFGLQAEYVLIKDPKPTHVEKNLIQLEPVKVIEDEIDDENFLAKPRWISPDDQGSFFVWDQILKKILKFDRDFKLVKIFLERGQGPGEIHPREKGLDKLYFSKDGQLYVSSPYNNKIIAFDRNGGYIKDIKFPAYMGGSIIPVVDQEGNIYLSSNRRNGIDVYDKNMKLKYTLLEKKDFQRFINHVPKDDKGKFVESYLSPVGNTKYDVLDGNRLVVYLQNSSTLYLFKENKLIRKFDIWPKEEIEYHKKRINRLKEKLNDSERFQSHMFSIFFIDKDDENYFYLHTKRKLENKNIAAYTYKFDLDGKLVCIYYLEDKVNIVAKRNNLFYSVGLWDPQVKIHRIKE